MVAIKDFDVMIVGAGFGGMYMLYKLRQQGLKVRVLEAGDGVGGTWYWNRYPGARCDVESVQYSLQFDNDLEQEWNWSERYAAQPEILRYANHVADRFDLRSDIQFNSRVSSAKYNETDKIWCLTTEDGEQFRASFCVMALGCLSAPNHPKFDGTEKFAGKIYHTGEWPHEGVDFTGQRVAVIGTGSSAIQSIPIIAKQAKTLTVFQRTANYAIPANNHSLGDEYIAEVKKTYKELRAYAKTMPTGVAFDFRDIAALESTDEERRAEYQKRWDRGGLSFLGGFKDLLFVKEANDTAAEFVREKIRSVVTDPEVADMLCPENIIGCKRLCVDIGYYQTYNLAHVKLVDVSKEPIQRITAKGVLAHGAETEVDAIVFATGFDAMTGALNRIKIEGRNGKQLKEKWHGGARSYLGLAVAGFPNLFTVTGPGSPSVLTNMLPSIEQHVEWIDRCIADLKAKGKKEIEAEVSAEDAWVDHVNETAELSLRSVCSSWYVGANVPGKARVFMPYIGGYPRYVAKCEDVVSKDYDGFQIS